MKLLLSLLLSISSFGIFHKDVPESTGENLIQVAILLDTSGSMSGLINQAKSQLWSILNTLSDAKMDGESPQIQIAIYEYGNDRLNVKNGYVLQRVPFTSDMDIISESLFAMTTNGGEEYCGEVIHQSIKDLEWRDKASLKVLYIAGNEPFTQGGFDFRVACMEAKKEGVVINTIFCGDRQEGINTDWEAGAILGLGAFHHIDHNRETKYVVTPYDDKISRLNSDLNKTYISYGKKGREAKMNMETQDANAGSFSQANQAQRTMYKCKKQYKNTSWDLVDAYEEDSEVLKTCDELPDDMKNLSETELIEKIEEHKEERNRIQNEIAQLGEQRVEYVRTHADKETGGLEDAISGSVEKLLKNKGFSAK